jgi:hypothetical protein
MRLELLLSLMHSQQPVGYSSDTAGFMGATLILSGIVAAVVTAPLFDRVFTSHLAITAKFLVPILAVAWLCFIWVGTLFISRLFLVHF